MAKPAHVNFLSVAVVPSKTDFCAMLTDMQALARAGVIAAEAHQGQTDKNGMPYLHHVMRVAMRCRTVTEKTCALLHDVVEDTPWTFEQLLAEGFSAQVVQVVRCLTKTEGEEYAHYLARVKGNPLAVRVKLADLEDNMDISRLNEVTEKDLPRLNRYIKAYHELTLLVS